jgi:hypothetical protein
VVLLGGLLLPVTGAAAKQRDRDHDGLTTRQERHYRTNPRRADTDRDRLKDGYEVRRSHTNPRRRDTDRDGLGDGYELRKSRTNPRKADTDGDGYGDLVELMIGTDPRSSTSPGRKSPITRDRTEPDTTITSGPAGSRASSDASFTFVSSKANSTFQCSLDAGPWQSCLSPKAYSLLGLGSHRFSVRARDAAGKFDKTPATRSWTVTSLLPPPDITPPDTTPPETTIASGPSGTVSTGDASFGFSSSESGSTFDCRLDGGSWRACTSPKGFTALANGSHTFEVRATDVAGNVDATPATRTWTVDVPPPDTTPPDTTITSGPSGTVAGSDASFGFSSSESGSTFECRLDGGSWGACTSPKGYTALANGSHIFEVRATDAAGNVDATPASRSWTVAVPPSVSCTKVASTTGSDSASGTLASPYRTAQKLVSSLSAGDTGCLRAGTYSSNQTVTFSQSGTSTAPITVRSYPGERATIQGRLVVADTANWVQVEELDLDGSTAPACSSGSTCAILPSPTVHGDDVTFAHNDVTNHHKGICLLLGTPGSGRAYRTKIVSNHIHDCGRIPSTNYDHGIYNESSTGAQILNNWIYDNVDRGVKLSPDSQYAVVRGNVIDGNGEGLNFGGLNGVASSNNTVDHNVISDSVIRWNVESYWPSGTLPGTGNVVYSNCVYATNANSYYDTGGGIASTPGYSAYNNTIANPQFVNRAGKDFTLAEGSPCHAAVGW